MGSFWSFLTDWASGNEEAYILILGLDASGKTTILNRLKTGENKVTIPTIGFNCEHIRFGRLSFIGFDLGGQSSIRKLWHNYFENADAIVFVIDSSDRARFREVYTELCNLTNHRYLDNCPILIFANKQDLNGVRSNELMSQLDLLNLLRDRDWKLCESTATTGDGIETGFSWLASIV
jgi:small GTP-binding protein